MPALAVVLLLSGIILAQSDHTSCSMGADVEQEYRSLPSMSDLPLSWEQRYGPRRTLAGKYPTNWALQFALQEPLFEQH
jgi:hypothetical protein